MKIYNPKHWFGILFQFHKYDTLRKLFYLIIIIAAYAGIVAYIELMFTEHDVNDHFKNLFMLHNLLGLALSLLLVFRTNTAYDRWWEGRKLWGALVNNSRNLAIKLNGILPADDVENHTFFRRVIPLYAFILRNHLLSESTLYDLDETEHPELKKINTAKHHPNQVAEMLLTRVQHLHQKGILSGEQLLFLNNELISFTDICGACERIKNTPIPYSYSAFIKKFIFIYIMTLPFGFTYSLHYLVVPLTAIVFYVLASLELIAEEIEDPFGKDSNDLPMDKIAGNIQKHVAEIL
jgi:putative membrane protein